MTIESAQTLEVKGCIEENEASRGASGIATCPQQCVQSLQCKTSTRSCYCQPWMSSKGGKSGGKGRVKGKREGGERGGGRERNTNKNGKEIRRLKDPWTLVEGREESPFCIELSTCFTAIVWASSLEKLSGEQTTRSF